MGREAMSYLYSLMFAYPAVGAALGVLTLGFQIWMIVDCVRNGNDLYWIWIILIFGPIGALIYFFSFVYGGSGIERSFSKRRMHRQHIEELQQKIHHLDKADHYAELGDVYRQQQKWSLAQQAYESALERDLAMFDAQAHLGYVLLAQNRAVEAWKFLGPAYQQKPQFDKGDLLWHCARCQAALGQLSSARELYERFLTSHSYLQAQVEYAEVLERLGDKPACIAALKQAIADGQNAPRFIRRTNRPWLLKARRLLITKGVKAQR